MATVYILYSKKIDRFYIGSCKDFDTRLAQHNACVFPNSFTAQSSDWKLYYSKGGLYQQQARQIEQHIKNMKSRKYLENLKPYPEISERLIKKFEGSSR